MIHAKRGRATLTDTIHLDEVFIRIRGKQHYLWRAVDRDGVVLDILVQERRDATAAKRFFKRLLAGLNYKPRKIVTDGPLCVRAVAARIGLDEQQGALGSGRGSIRAGL